MHPRFAARTVGIQTSGIRKMFEIASKDAVHLGLGEPDFQPPAEVQAALSRAVAAGQNKYASISGIPDLKAAIADYNRHYRPDLSAEQVVVTIGGSEALWVAALGFYDHGDEVLIPDPGFVFYGPHARLMGATPVPYTLRQEDGFLPREEELKDLVGPKTKAIVVNSPSNPTGGVFSEQHARAIADLAADHDLVIISDEVYDRLVYEGSHHSMLTYSDRTVMVNSFSKTLAMTGWRLGYLIADHEVAEKLGMLHYYTVACAPTPVQVAAVAGLSSDGTFLAAMKKAFRARRDRIVARLNGIEGFHCPAPKGAFYAMPTVDFRLPDQELAMHLLRNGVVCSPGSAFGAAGAGHLRFSYATSEATIDEGMDRIAAAVKDLPRT